jgi:hypothetical protein
MNRAAIKIYRSTRGLLVIAALCFLSSVFHQASAQELRPTEYQVKMAYLYNFARLVDWPAEAFDGPQAPFVLGILGENPFGHEFDSVNGKTVKGRTLIIKKINDVQDIKSCHILFVCASEKGRWQLIFKTLQRGNVLTVGDTEGFARAGGVVNFIVTDKNVAFEVNVDAAARKHLSFSSRILNIAVLVHDAAKPEGQ